jgi:flagellar biosynthesis/type III secretory pathway chaperone
MDERVERLCAVLGEEAELCAHLAGVLRREQEAVVGLRTDAIFSCVAERETLHGRLLDLADRRRGLIRTVGAAHGRATSSANELLPLLPEDTRLQVRTRLRTLRRLLLEARSLEQQTALLVGGSLETVTELLRVLRSHVPGARYGADASVAAPAMPERMRRRA